MKMHRYRVRCQTVVDYDVTVHATSEDQAKALAQDACEEGEGTEVDSSAYTASEVTKLD